MFRLYFENQVFEKPADFEGDLSIFPTFVQSALAFCHAWLQGKESFELSTSGSTGTPKIIQITRAQMEASAKATGLFFRINSESKLLCCLSPEYIAGKMMLARALVWNCEIWLVEASSNPLSMDQTFDFVAMVPLQVESSLKSQVELSRLKKVKNLLIGGAAISESIKQNLVTQDIHAWQSYGMTETVSHIALAPIQNGDLKYQTLPDVEIGQDERGALWVKSPMSGSEKIQTNDLVELTSETEFKWLGRADFVVNSGGIKLFPETLEKRSEPIIAEFYPQSAFFFHGKPDEKLGQRLILIIEGTPEIDQTEKIIQGLQNILGKYEVPKEVCFVPEFFRTPNGKINRILTFAKL